MREFSLIEYQKLLKSNVPYVVRVDPLIVDETGDHEMHLYLASDKETIDSIDNAFGNLTAPYHISSSDEILLEMANGVSGIKFYIE